MVCLMDTVMSVTTRKTIKADFNLTFKDAEKVSAQDIVNWALNTSEFYGHFFDVRFKPRAEKAIKEDRFEKYERTYRPQFNEFTAWELIPSEYREFIHYMVNSLQLKNILYDEIPRAANSIYDYYLKHFKELKDLT